VPQLTETEWGLLREGLAALPPERLGEIRRDMAALAGQQSRPVVCPLLDQTTGACPVYAQRPVACRTYGFYVQRDKGLYCSDIESRVAEGALADVVWGNHDAIDQRLTGLGESRPLTEWFARWECGC
jgi:Fe-S-cluster containining protein